MCRFAVKSLAKSSVPRVSYALCRVTVVRLLCGPHRLLFRARLLNNVRCRWLFQLPLEVTMNLARRLERDRASVASKPASTASSVLDQHHAFAHQGYVWKPTTIGIVNHCSSVVYVVWCAVVCQWPRVPLVFAGAARPVSCWRCPELSARATSPSKRHL